MSAHHANTSSSTSTSLYGAQWRRSSRSTGMNNCLEAARLGCGRLAVRDSKNVSFPALLFTPGTWTTFLAAVRNEAPGSLG
ncbi:DUF397 domain-containing protein [Streptomyces sp. NBC_01465]|uniref:DUF397 domain-containing protein n=1 Tax=Streptomyces sp. NBC_01465 TaxID=2903878 RepID=UPI002E365FF4|nr:DUF397 domain-containing protein [Streptomyces sp. NBC_01465]